jgi:hypothetical protein
MGWNKRSVPALASDLGTREPERTCRAVGLVALVICGALHAGGAARAGASTKPVPGGPATPTSAYATAGLGSLTVTSAIVIGGTTVRFLGGWSSPAASCQASRRVVLDATLDYQPFSPAPRPARLFRLQRRGAVENCSESGPNLVLAFPVRRLGLSCPAGVWHRGRYELSATALVTAPNGMAPDTSLRAVADLVTNESTPCQ